MDLASDAKGTAAYDSCTNSVSRRYQPQKVCSVNVGGMVCKIEEVMVFLYDRSVSNGYYAMNIYRLILT
jgi:hypothetical protein